VDEDSGICGVDVEVVVVAAGDGQVPHPPGGDGGVVPAEGSGGGAGGGAQAGAVLEGGGLDPAVVPGVEEQVIAGGVDDRGPVRGGDAQVIQVSVMADQDSGDRLGAGLAGRGVRGQDLVALAELADRHQVTGGSQDPGRRGEAFPAGPAGRAGVVLGGRPRRFGVLPAAAGRPAVAAVAAGRAGRAVAGDCRRGDSSRAGS
jgi:hypothetical protein